MIDSGVSKPFAVGSLIGQGQERRYEIVRSIGAGATGAVYAARDTKAAADTLVAIKVLHADLLFDEDTMRRFLGEARTTAQIRSAHVASVYECGVLDSGQPYIVLELLVGNNLEELRERDGVFSVDNAVTCILQCLAGLSAAHVAGFVHRDLKPANLFLAEDKSAQPPRANKVKILDFGLAKAVKDHARNLTKTHAVFGTPAYIAPEQLKSSKHVDCRADIWSVGVVLYELLTNHLPFDGSDLESYVRAVMDGAAIPPSRHRPDLPPGFAEVILRCLQKRPSDRFATATELARALAPFAPPHCRSVLEEIERVADSEARTVAAAAVAPLTIKEERVRAAADIDEINPRMSMKLIALLIAGGVVLLLAMGFVGFVLSSK